MAKLPPKQLTETVKDYYHRVITTRQYWQLESAGWAVVRTAKAASLIAQIAPQPKWRIYVKGEAKPIEELITKFLSHPAYPQWAAARIDELHEVESEPSTAVVNAYLTVRLADSIKFLIVIANKANPAGKKNLFPEDVGKRYYSSLLEYLTPQEWELVKRTRA